MKREISILLSSLATSLFAQERPNILWLTIEDTSWYEFGCYGNEQVLTPNIDQMAKDGVRYTNAWSVAPQSSPARSSIITGSYATSFAMDFHRNRQSTPSNIYFPQLLRDAGYFCTNNRKTDYNSSELHDACWDECSGKASYNSSDRKEGQPFFSVFNAMMTHMGRIRSFHLEHRRDFSKEGLNPEQLILPPHLPDLEAVRSDYAFHLEGVQDVDKWVGFFLKDLKEKGLDDNTIVFFFSDHGGCSPRGKGYLNETGLRIPLIVYLPERWSHLSDNGVNISESRLVNFTDLAPTLLSIAGIDIPENKFQGNPFLGTQTTESPKYQFAFTSNQHHNYMPVRAVTNGRYKYIRNYIPYKHSSLRNYYQWGMPSNMAWDSLFLAKDNINPILKQPFIYRNSEMLFDLENDIYEINDLSSSPTHKEVLNELSEAMSNHLRDTKDLGFMIPSSRGSDVNLYNKVRANNYPINELYDLVEKSSKASSADIKYFTKYLNHQENEFRYWASVGITNLIVSGVKVNIPKEFISLINDNDDYIAAEVCFGLAHIDKYRKAAMNRMITPVKEEYRKAGYSLLECIALNKSTRKWMTPVLPTIRESAKSINIKDNEDSGLIARGILVNCGEMILPQVYGEEGYNIGVSANKNRRKCQPTP